ncbi:major facilitator superfamily domain-containing protein [Ditylenchus destructor]|uniref:Major facilitator superfamily domain-containing protein n=1 Tax=Ditylenchus destructor TaxID=166010 RepID=A0AAD4MUQ1_9BILA|nr:major facilitator superfamily domain-containing protein [Ditylenchus destructor]
MENGKKSQLESLCPKKERSGNGKGLASEIPSHNFYFGHSTRYLVLCLSILCLSLIMSNSLAFNFTIICMTAAESNGTANSTVEFGSYGYSQAERNSLFSAIAVGTILGTIPITYLTSRFGVRKIFTIYGLISAFSTIFTPICAYLGFMPFFAMRVLQGVALSTCWPAIGSIIAEWSTIRHSGVYIALLSCHLQMGPIFTMPVSGELCESEYGWPAVYYLQGFLTLFAVIGFYLFFRDSPKYHRNVSDKELTTIQCGKHLGSAKPKVPFIAMIKDITVWGIIASNIGGTLGLQIFMQYGPIYLNKALKFNIKGTGFAAALPYLLSAVTKFIAGPCSDHIICLSGKVRVIMFASLSQFLMASCFVALAFLPTTYPTLIQACFTGATVFSGLNCVGVGKSTQLVSRQFSYVLMSVNSFTTSIIVLLIPYGVSLLAPNNTTDEWGRIFLIISTIVVVTAIMFDFTAQVDPRPWTYSVVDSGNNGKLTVECDAADKNVFSNIEAVEISQEEAPNSMDDTRVRFKI